MRPSLAARPIVRAVKAANAAFRFALEMVTLAVFVWWGFATEDGPAAILRGFGVALLDGGGVGHVRRAERAAARDAAGAAARCSP